MNQHFPVIAPRNPGNKKRISRSLFPGTLTTASDDRTSCKICVSNFFVLLVAFRLSYFCQKCNRRANELPKSLYLIGLLSVNILC